MAKSRASIYLAIYHPFIHPTSNILRHLSNHASRLRSVQSSFIRSSHQFIYLAIHLLFICSTSKISTNPSNHQSLKQSFRFSNHSSDQLSIYLAIHPAYHRCIKPFVKLTTVVRRAIYPALQQYISSIIYPAIYLPPSIDRSAIHTDIHRFMSLYLFRQPTR